MFHGIIKWNFDGFPFDENGKTHQNYPATMTCFFVDYNSLTMFSWRKQTLGAACRQKWMGTGDQMEIMW